jgi:hypothetical protein
MVPDIVTDVKVFDSGPGFWKWFQGYRGFSQGKLLGFMTRRRSHAEKHALEMKASTTRRVVALAAYVDESGRETYRIITEDR